MSTLKVYLVGVPSLQERYFLVFIIPISDVHVYTTPQRNTEDLSCHALTQQLQSQSEDES